MQLQTICTCLIRHLWFFCLKLFLQHMQINSFMTYMLSCSTSSATNCGHLCVVPCHHFHEMCACAISLHINVINILLLSHYSYHSLSCETVAQFYKITYDDSMCTHIKVFDSVPSESLLLWLHLNTLHDMVKLDFHHLLF